MLKIETDETDTEINITHNEVKYVLRREGENRLWCLYRNGKEQAGERLYRCKYRREAFDCIIAGTFDKVK